MLATLYLGWTLAAVCPRVDRYRARGYSDTQIEEMARAAGVPEKVITWARRSCMRS